MYNFCSSIAISGFRSNRVFPGYCAQPELSMSGGHGAVSNSGISSVLLCAIPRFCSAAK